jgi:SM-20-related protein
MWDISGQVSDFTVKRREYETLSPVVYLIVQDGGPGVAICGRRFSVWRVAIGRLVWSLPDGLGGDKRKARSVKTLDMEAFAATPLVREPFEYLIVPGFVKPEARAAVNRDYPQVPDLGSFPLERLKFGPAFQEMVDDLESDEFRKAFETKFSIDLTGRPSTITARGRCGTRDGFIHTDSTSKIITVLIYMNNGWEAQGGRLRLLKSGSDLEDMLAEVPPVEGTLVCFKRSDNSWHGHKQFIGERRVIQFNWVTDKGSQKLVALRHSLSIPFKKVMSMVRPQREPVEAGNPQM